MTRRSNFKQADVSKALKGATALGLRPIGYRIDTLGRIEVMLEQGVPKAANCNPWDEELR